MPNLVKVISNSIRNRVLFEGTREDAEKFVRDNYPRNHVDVGNRDDQSVPAADVSIVDGKKTEVLSGGEFVSADEFGVPKAPPVKSVAPPAGATQSPTA